MSNFKLGYNDSIIKAKDSGFCIHKMTAKLMNQYEIFISFDEKNLEITLFGKGDLEKSQTKEAKDDISFKSKPISCGPFKIVTLGKAQKFFKNGQISLLKGKINKFKNFKLDGVETNDNLKGVTGKQKENFEEIINGRTVWILSPTDLQKRTLLSTNPESVKNLVNEENRRACEVEVSIMKNELEKLTNINYFKDCLKNDD